MSRSPTLALVLVALSALATLAPAADGIVGPLAPEGVSRDLQPVVLTGAAFPDLSVLPNYVELPPLPFEEEERDGVYVVLPVAADQPAGTPTDDLFAFRWTGSAFEEIPLQVDERFLRYLTNYASGFAPYSQADAELTYAFDTEGKRKEGERADAPWVADWTTPGVVTTPDPVAGLDHDDELAFMARDAGARAPKGAAPAGVDDVHEVALLDPLDPSSARFVYVGRSSEREHAPLAPYVTYSRDADADLYVESNHWDYGGAPGGWCHRGDGVDAPFGAPTPACSHRRPKDSATVTAEAYRFHYSGRWKLDGLDVRQADGSWSGSLIDRWKGRAFQQVEGNAADVGGFEDENDWSRSSVTLGERAGPVRVLRETWGSDSGTHVTRLDVFYADVIHQVYHMRVHPVPPDGVYAFWDHRAGMIDTYYTAMRPDGVPVDGVRDEVYGTNSEWQEAALGETWFAVDVPDPTMQPALANFAWDQASGPFGSIVTVLEASRTHSGALLPYYRDDAAFDDGTGHDPRPQGSFGAHGIHFLFTGEADNLFLPVPTTEFVAEATQYVFRERMPNVGDAVDLMERAPLVALVRDAAR